MELRILLVGLLALALPVAAGPGHDDPEPAAADDHSGVLGDDIFNNGTWSHTFTEATTFEYHCHPHPWMQATITVVESDGSAPQNHTINVYEPEDFEQWSFDPEELTIMVGDTVTWFNGGEQMHKIGETTAEHADHIAGAGSTVDAAGDGHDHEHSDGGPGGLALWVGAGLLGGLGIALWAKKQSP